MLDLMGATATTAAAKRSGGAGAGESTPLLLFDPSNASGDSAIGGNTNNNNSAASPAGQQYYFVPKTDYPSGTHGELVEEIPEGSHTDEFAPKRLTPIVNSRNRAPKNSPARVISSNNNNNASGRSLASSRGRNTLGSFLSRIFGGVPPPPPVAAAAANTPTHIGDIGTMVKPRKAPIKIEPKVFFANERTFLAWMHLSVTLAGASIAIMAFAEDQNPISQLYGVLLLPVAIAFIVYSMYQYSRRAYMIRNRHPGPYEDTVGPAILGIMLMISIVAQFALKLYSVAGAGI